MIFILLICMLMSPSYNNDCVLWEFKQYNDCIKEHPDDPTCKDNFLKAIELLCKISNED